MKNPKFSIGEKVCYDGYGFISEIFDTGSGFVYFIDQGSRTKISVPEDEIRKVNPYAHYSYF